MQLSIIIPCYNEEKRLKKTLKQIVDYILEKKYKTEPQRSQRTLRESWQRLRAQGTERDEDITCKDSLKVKKTERLFGENNLCGLCVLYA